MRLTGGSSWLSQCLSHFAPLQFTREPTQHLISVVTLDLYAIRTAVRVGSAARGRREAWGLPADGSQLPSPPQAWGAAAPSSLCHAVCSSGSYWKSLLSCALSVTVAPEFSRSSLTLAKWLETCMQFSPVLGSTHINIRSYVDLPGHSCNSRTEIPRWPSM